MTPLQPGDMLQWFRIESVLGKGGFGITYLATDTNLDHYVAIKEYAPDLQVDRAPDQSLQPVSAEVDESYQTGLGRFISEARTLVKFNHPNIVRILTVFSANNTAYLVMDFEEGEVFSRFIKANHPVSEQRLKDIFVKIIDGLAQVHDKGFLHRDIKPGNIIIRKDGDPVLLDFGCARPSLLPDTNTQTAFVSPGYSPLEQFHSVAGLEEGPWTDIYALSATLHFAITTQTPTNSASRLTAISSNLPDPLPKAEDSGLHQYSREFLRAIDWGLRPTIADRPQSLSEWRDALNTSASNTPDETVLLQRPLSVPLEREVDTGTVILPPTHRTGRPNTYSQPVIYHDEPRSSDGRTDLPSQPWDESIPTRYDTPPAPKSKSGTGILAAAAVLAFAAGGGYLWYASQTQNTAPTDTTAETTSTPADQQTTSEPQPTASPVASAETPTNNNIDSADTATGLLAQANDKLIAADLTAARALLEQASESQADASQVRALTAKLNTAEGDKLKIATAEQLIQFEQHDKALAIIDEIRPDSVFSNQASAVKATARAAMAANAQALAQQQADAEALDSLLTKAESAADRGQWQTAIENYQQANELDNDNTEIQSAIENTTSAWLQSIEQDIVNGRLQTAQSNVTALTQALGSSTRLDQLIVMLNNAEQREKDAEEKRLAELASQQQKAEQQRLAEIAEQKRTAEQQRQAEIAEQERIAEQQRQAEIAKQKRIAEQQRQAEIAEQERIAEQQRQAEIAKQQRIAEQQRQAELAEQKRLAEIAEQKRIAEQQRQAEIAKEKRLAEIAEQKRIAEQQRQAEIAEQQRQAQLAEQRRLAEVAEQERLAEQKRQEAAAEQEKLSKFASLLAATDGHLNSGDLSAAQGALSAAKQMNIQDRALTGLNSRYQAALQAEQARPKISSVEAIKEADTRFQQLARALMNRNERAVSLLTDGDPAKLDLMKAIFSKYKQIDVKINNLERTGNENSVSAVLSFERLSLPDGTTTIPSSSWRHHSIKVEYDNEGWSKVLW